MKSIFRELWEQYRNDTCSEVQEAEGRDPVEIFGLLKKSNRRLFVGECIVLDIRPFEDWDRSLEKEEGSRLEWLEREQRRTQTAVLLECGDGGRVMGLMATKEFNRMGNVGIGDRVRVRGVFEYIKLLREKEVFLFCRIRELTEF